jgi:hypothetical protein
LLEIGAPYLADLVHANHPISPSQPTEAKGEDADTQRQRGSLLDAKIAPQGVIIASEFTRNSDHCVRLGQKQLALNPATLVTPHQTALIGFGRFKAGARLEMFDEKMNPGVGCDAVFAQQAKAVP